jgi:colicin import membrane protein
MSAAVYHEPYKLPAGLLALGVHGAFFALLYFGFSWQEQPPATMSVELWDSLPAARIAAAPEPPKVEEVAEPQAEAQEQPDIALPDKKAEDKPKAAAKKPGSSILERQYALEQAARAEQAAAAGRVVDEYKAKIQNKIMSKIVDKSGVPPEAYAQFMVTVLPGGAVLSTQLLKSSGYPAFDDAVERGILKAQPLPLPPDMALFKEFRELRLTFRPKE